MRQSLRESLLLVVHMIPDRRRAAIYDEGSRVTASAPSLSIWPSKSQKPQQEILNMLKGFRTRSEQEVTKADISSSSYNTNFAGVKRFNN
jgi:hypothetical protein